MFWLIRYISAVRPTHQQHDSLLTDRSIGRLTNWLVDGSIDWLIDGLINWLINWTIGGSVCGVVNWLIDCWWVVCIKDIQNTYRKEKISLYLRLFSTVFSSADPQAGCSRVIILCFQKFSLTLTQGEARRFLMNLQGQSHTNLLLFFHTTSNGPLICYLPVHSRHSCILKTFSQSSQRSFSPRYHHTMRKLLNVYTQA